MIIRFLHILFLLIFCAVLAQAQEALFADPNFSKEAIDADIGFITGVTFDDNGRGYVWTKDGAVYLMEDDIISDEPWIDLEDEVRDISDHGLLGFALDPDFLNNGHVYLLYRVDRNYLLNHEDPDYVPNLLINGPSIGRLTRYTADPTLTTILPESRLVLLGETINNGISLLHGSHGVGSIVFGSDGSLLLTAGDGSTWQDAYGGDGPPYFGEYVEEALADGIITDELETGSFRAQQIQSYNGKVLRINPETGEGYPSNPFYDPDQPNAAVSKVYALGLRNPYRFLVRPGTGSADVTDGFPGQLFVADVGAGRKEELNVINESGLNYGWPIHEGIPEYEHYTVLGSTNPFAPNPLAGGDCPDQILFTDLLVDPSIPQQSHINSCDGVSGVVSPFAQIHEPPTLEYASLWQGQNGEGAIPGFNEEGELIQVFLDEEESGVNYPGLRGYGSIAGTFYQGETWPQNFHELYFHCDFDGWIKAFEFSPEGELLLIEDFLTQTGFGIYHLEYNPMDESMYMLEYPGLMFKISYGQSDDPVAVIDASPEYGQSPLSVTLDGSASFSPINEQLSFSWDVGGTAYTGDILQLTLNTGSSASTEIPVTLTVTDELGGTDIAATSLSLNNTPPSAIIVTFSDGEKYPTDKPSFVPLNAMSEDSEQSQLNKEWQLLLHHNTHYHIDYQAELEALSYNVVPVGCDGPPYWYRFVYECEDGYGLSAYDEVEIFPYCGPMEIPEFTSIEHTASSQGNLFRWEFTVEENVDRVVTYRGDTPHALFPIDTTLANGASELSFLDQSVISSNQYYAFKMLTADSVFRFSLAEVYQNTQLEHNLFVYPNPAMEDVAVLGTDCSGEYNFEIFDSEGRLVRRLTGICETVFREQLDISNLRPGIYILRLSSDSSVLDARLLVAGRNE